MIRVKTVSFVVACVVAFGCSPKSQEGSKNTPADKSKPVVVQKTEILPVGDLARDSEGNILHLQIADAIKYCEGKGTRLPTIREVAIFASKTFGSRGIQETKFPDQVPSGDPNNPVDIEMEKMHVAGFQIVWHFNSQNQRAIDFYYSKSGYTRPDNWSDLWTSSPYPDSDIATDDYYWYGGDNGEFYDLSYAFHFEVRCVIN